MFYCRISGWGWVATNEKASCGVAALCFQLVIFKLLIKLTGPVQARRNYGSNDPWNARRNRLADLQALFASRGRGKHRPPFGERPYRIVRDYYLQAIADPLPGPGFPHSRLRLRKLRLAGYTFLHSQVLGKEPPGASSKGASGVSPSP
jgi:hypothetical protein